ncbi:tetratricopeptide repeat protein [Occallatibacter savannae]|uniref:tetratricopeptide repeat protein n=1 Tax=Occallatibacter savannae TaxID=1002691 RepID=UPI000D693A82|nr:tetratricopeptide repeat protein [Occallatibacter savannae]
MKSFSCGVLRTTKLSLVAAALALCVCPAVLGQAGDAEVTPKVQQLYAEANAASEGGDAANAIEKYRAIIKLAPHLAAAYNNLGALYFDQRDYAHAAETLKRGLELNPNMPTAAAILGMSYVQLGENDKAEPLLRKALRANPKDDKVEMTLTRMLMNEKKLDEAARHLNDYLARNPNDQQAWYMLGKTYLQLSENSLKKINEIDPDSVVAHEIAGEIDESMHNYDLALVEYKKAVDAAPEKPGTHMHMGDAYWYIGKWKSAQDEFRAELKNDPYNCMAHWKLANAILEANDSNDEALTEANAAIERCPALMQARVDRARALVRLGRQPEALPDLLMAMKDSPREPSIHFLLANVYRSQGKNAEAQKEMQTYGTLQREASAAVAGQASSSAEIKNAAH